MRVSHLSEETQIELAKPNDERAVKTFLLYLRHMPITLIERAQGVKRRQVYDDIVRAKEIFHLPQDFPRDLVYESAEALREAWQNYQAASTRLEQGAEEKERVGLEIQKSTYLGMIDKMLRTRAEVVKLLTPKSESISVTTVKTPQGEGIRVELKQERRGVYEILDSLKKEGKIGNTS